MIGIIGAGTMGTDIAALFANADFEVILVDIDKKALERAIERHKGEALEQLQEAGIKMRDEVVSNVKYTTNLGELGGCKFVVEAINEKLDNKIENRTYEGT